MWTIALYGSDDYLELDTNGEVTLTALGTTDVATDPNWLKFSIIGGSPEYEEDGELIESISGYEHDKSTQRLVFKFEVEPYTFPADMSAFVDYKNLKKKKYKYIYNIDYPDDNMPIHSLGNAVAVNISKEVEHDFEHGIKKLIITVRKAVIE